MDTDEKNEENIDMKQIADYPIDIVEPNSIIQGEVVTIDNEFVYVNVGIKTDGRVTLEEFEDTPKIGDIIEVLLVDKRMIDGMYVFSKKMAEREKIWQKFIDSLHDDSQYVSGTITSLNNKGMVINCDGVEGFLPFYHAADIRSKKNPDPNEAFQFKIRNIDRKKRTIILTRREYLDEEKERRWDNFLSKYNISDRVKGKVVKFVEFGAFIEIEGIDALLHRNDMSWRKVFKHQKLLQIGEEREFVILNILREEGKISLGLKQLTEDPWLSVNEKYKIGDVVSGKIVTLTNSGVFVEIEEGVDGYIDSSEISWTQKNINPNEVFKKGQQIEIKIIAINKEDKRMPLSYKQLHPNPWDTIEERFGAGTIHKTKIKKIVAFGMFVELEKGIDGLVHISDVTWDENNKTAIKQYKVGNDVEFKILDIKKDEMKIACGIKQLTKSPWEIIKGKFPSGSDVSGVISGIVPFGLFIKIEDDIEGLVHISEVSQKRIEKLEDQFKINDKVNAVVLGIDVDKKRLSLSIKNYDVIVEKEQLNKVLNDAGSKKVTLGDFLKIELDK